MIKWVFQNDSFVEEEKALIHFKDLSFQRGYGIFDFFRLVGDSPLFLDEHLDRFYYSAGSMHLPVPLDRLSLKAAIAELIQKNNLPGTGIRISLTGGYSEDDFNIGTPALLISQHPFSPPTEKQIQEGISLFTHCYQRPLPHVKSIDYLMAVWLQPTRLAKKTDDILYVKDGVISECPRSNFFLVTENNTIVTPAENALAGITRKKVLQLAKESFTVEERAVSPEEFATAKEAFITSTTKQILPVKRVDAITFPQNTVAPELLQRFRSTYMKA